MLPECFIFFFEKWLCPRPAVRIAAHVSLPVDFLPLRALALFKLALCGGFGLFPLLYLALVWFAGDYSDTL